MHLSRNVTLPLLTLVMGVLPSTTYPQLVEAPFEQPPSQSTDHDGKDASGAGRDKSVAGSQASQDAARPQDPHRKSEVFRDFARNQRAIWTSPLHVRRDDLKWLLPLGGVTAGLFTTDKRVLEAEGDSKGQLDASRYVSFLGSTYVTLGVAGSLYAAGRLAHNDRSREAGLLALQAVIHSQIVLEAVKLATQRDRPKLPVSEQGRSVWNKSFPSGHATTSWALARVVAAEYPDHRLVGWGAYGLATAISISRVTGRKHYPSDVLVGGAIGYLTGDYLVRQQKKNRGIPHAAMIAPCFRRATHSRGVAILFSFYE